MSKRIKPNKLRYLILKELLENDRVVSARDLNISPLKLQSFILGMQKDGLVQGFLPTKSGIVPSDARVTLSGEEYISNNSDLAKIYKGMKEIRDWIPFLYN